MNANINIGIIGFGIVGCGALQIIQKNRKSIETKIGSGLTVKRIADIDPDRPRPVEFDRGILTTDAYDIINDPEIDIVVETIGGVEPAGRFVMDAIKNGKHIVTANKELIAKEGHALLEEAGDRKQDFMFEASVGGGIPIIQPLKLSLAGNEIQEVKGIVNGTTNYILTRMSEEGSDFADALKEAQEKGYAETDPTNDIDGHDAAYKIAILASIAFTSRADVTQVYREGIRDIEADDIAIAQELGYKVKLLAIAKLIDGAVQARVHPTLVPCTHPLASIREVYNAIMVRGDAAGDVMFYGQGAGALAAGSAVVGDIIDVARNIHFDATGRISCTCFEKRPMLGMDAVVGKYYARIDAEDRPRVLASIAQILGENEVSIESIIQRPVGSCDATLVFVTHEVPEPRFRKALSEIESLPVVKEIGSWMRVEE